MSSQPPTQAGKFKPRKPKPKKTSTSIKPPSSGSTPAASSSASGSRDKSPSGRGEREGKGSKDGRGGGRGRGGRGGRDRGRGRGRGRGRFVKPKGQVFFTANATASDNVKNKDSRSDPSMIDDKEAVIFMPGMSGSTTSKISGPALVASTAEGRLAAAAQARKGEGDEIIVGEMEEGFGVGDNKKASGGILSRTRLNKGPSMFDDEEEADGKASSLADYTYDSDSSEDGEIKRMAQQINAFKSRGKGGRSQPAPLLPQQLPLPPTKRPGLNRIDYMYECQSLNQSSKNNKNQDEMKKKVNEVVMDDPPLEPPFLNLNKATPEAKKDEEKSWMIFKFPTRLPRLQAPSTLSGMAVKKENEMDLDENIGDDDDDDEMDGLADPSEPSPDNVTSSSNSNPNSSSKNHTGLASTRSSGFDDTLKDSAAGRYGKIVMYKSGKTYLIVGDKSDSKNPPVKMLLSSGLPCGFVQQAVTIDTDNGYIPLGEVKNSFVVTPDVEEAFPIGR